MIPFLLRQPIVYKEKCTTGCFCSTEHLLCFERLDPIKHKIEITLSCTQCMELNPETYKYSVIKIDTKKWGSWLEQKGFIDEDETDN